MAETKTTQQRDLMKTAAAGTAVLGGLIPSRVLGANDRINIGVIGVGGMGGGHFHGLVDRAKDSNQKLQVVLACDVWDVRAQSRADYSGGTAQTFRDYREALQAPGLDAVVIATPDHWHSTIAIAAMEAGKDVYCEKPVTLYWHQAKEVAECARRTGRVFQCGVQSTSDDRWWQAQRLIKAGALGQLIWSQTGAFRNDPNGDWNWGIQPCQPGVDLDWDMWLGHEWGLAPERPYDPERYSRFRKYWDYSGGLATDLLYHSYGHLGLALGPEFPVRVAASGGNYVHTWANDNREVPDTFHCLLDLEGGHSVAMFATQENDTGVEELIRGQEATLRSGGPGLLIHPEPPYRRAFVEKVEDELFEGCEIIRGQDDQGRETIQEIRVPQQGRPGHMDKFLECVRNQDPQTHMDADVAYKIAVGISLAVRAFREQRVVQFDPEKEEVIA